MGTPSPRDLADLLHRLGPRWVRWTAEQIPRDGLHPARLRVLQALTSRGAMPMGDLARVSDTSAANVSKLVSEMAADGLVARTPSPEDGRVILASVTPDGEAALRAAWDGYLDRVSAVFTGLTDESRSAIAAALEALLAVLPDAGHAKDPVTPRAAPAATPRRGDAS